MPYPVDGSVKGIITIPFHYIQPPGNFLIRPVKIEDDSFNTNSICYFKRAQFPSESPAHGTVNICRIFCDLMQPVNGIIDQIQSMLPDIITSPAFKIEQLS